MPISRGQMPRQLYGLGSLVKSLTKGVKGAVKGVAKTVKKNPLLGLAALNFAPMLFKGGAPFIGLGNKFAGGKFAGSLFNLPGMSGVTDFFSGDKTFGKTMGILAGGTLLGGVLDSLSPEEKEEVSSGRNVEALRTKLTEAYKNQRTFSDSENEDAAIAAQVQSDLSEYTSGLGGYAEGGRIGYARGDTAEQNAMQASGIMDLPLNQNPAGVTELDLRETGGFIPPVGVKEKADDIPAMLSNNEFVFTADAVRGMGDGNVNVGAQRMYDMMKKLENGGRV